MAAVPSSEELLGASGPDRQAPEMSQTLARGLDVLERLCVAPGGLTIPELSLSLGLHRAIVSRLVHTLEHYGLVERAPDRRFRLGLHMLELSRGVRADLRAYCEPVLRSLADRLGCTAVLLLRDGDDAVVTLVVEPESGHLHLSFRLGSRHPLGVGAEGMAILCGRPAQPGERPEVTAGRSLGYVVSTGEVQPGTWGLAVPVRAGWRPAEASIGVISTAPMPEHEVAEALHEAASLVAGCLG